MAARGYKFYFRVLKVREIENTSWKVLAYGIYALVFVSEILLVRCAHSFDF